MARWKLDDRASAKSGYWQITKNGVRIADVFPFAKGADKEALWREANRIVDAMNAIDSAQEPNQ